MSRELESVKSALDEAQKVLQRRANEISVARKRLTTLTGRLNDHVSLLRAHEELVPVLERLGLAESARALREYVTSLSAAGRTDFEKDFPRLCQDLSLLPVTGTLDSGYRVRGAIEVRANFSRGQVRVSTVSESRTVSPPTARGAVDAVQPIYKRLYQRPFDQAEFERALVDAFSSAGGRWGESVLLTSVHKQLFLSRQKAEFFRDTSSKRLVGYPLDEFSGDLGRFLQAGAQGRAEARRMTLELGRDGIVVFTEAGGFDSYKFLRID